ncbi:MAG TPA: glycosyltransferase family 2 protein [Anaerolineales bacterium]|jgi:glycosyltransferase involved in cell wall biosynthesis
MTKMAEPDIPLVTIVTPSLNQGAFLEAAIRSVLEQDYGNLEYLIIDGASTDNSLEILRKYAHRLAYWESEPDRGQAHAINKGLKRAKGQILGWLNSDDVLLPDTVSRAVEILRKDPELDVVYGRLERIDSNGKAVPTPLLPKDRVEFDPSNAIGECVVNQPGSFWRRSIMEQVGYLDEQLTYAFDYEYWVRILLGGGKFKRLPHPVAKFRLSPGSKTVGQTGRAAREHLKVIDQILAEPGLDEKLGISPDSIGQQARRGRSIIEMYAFYGCLKEREWLKALRWLIRAHASSPGVLLSRRWLDLAAARLNR